MPTLTIDNQSATVPTGTNVLEAARGLGIVIPHFCYHEALGAVGACRLCAMMFEEGPVKGVQMACMIEAKDGMVISTVDAEAAELRAHVIEWLMMNHPHDCPVCDEGGECQLQDMTIAGGHSIRRFRGQKRTFRNQDLGPFVEQEMNRCIQCYRCVRTYQDYCGGDDFGVMGSRDRIFYGRFKEGRLQSPFSGNLVDVCPTGVFTDKPFRFKSRYWDLEEAPSVCPHCSLGCATIPGGRYRELQRVRSGVNREVNGFFLCDRGRFGYGHANHPERPRSPLLGGREVSWDEALGALRASIARTVATHGPQSVALLGSPRATLEANGLLRRWADELGCRLQFDIHPQRDRAARLLAARLGDKARSLAEIGRSDLLILIGADPLAEAPMLALALRQAVRAGGQVAVLDPRPVQLPCACTHLPLSPEQLLPALQALAAGDAAALPRQQSILLEGLIRQLGQAQRPVLIGGADLLGAAGMAALLAAANQLSTPERPCGVMGLLAGPNSFGAALLSPAQADADALLDAIQQKTVKALICLESDPFSDHSDPARVQLALAQLEYLAVLDHLPTQAVRRADLFLPTTAPAEGSGCFVNNEGRLLPFAPVIAPGVPIRQTGHGDHPPRSFSRETPGSQPRPAWATLAELLETSIDLSVLRHQLEQAFPAFAGLASLELEGSGLRVSGLGSPPSAVAPAAAPAGAGLRLLATETLFGSELLSCLSPPLAAVTPAPFVLLHPAEAETLGLSDGQRLRLTTPFGFASVALKLSAEMAPGLVIAPRLRGTALENLVPGGGLLTCSLSRGEAP
ncbi:MAG: NADH-quinone oxidoreductase subunit NuoG [Trichloromonadaceae bacterium]